MPGQRADLAPPLTDLKEAVRACKFRDYNLEGYSHSMSRPPADTLEAWPRRM